VALTGAYSQWYGDHVGMFGADHLEKDPKVWSYGVEYTPVPLVSGFITQKSTERGRTDTEFGLNFTYHFGMPWEDQTSHSKVAELRTVGGSRHEFVDRENRIILEYKAKNSYSIEYLGPDGARGFRFRIKNGFGEFAAGQTVRVTAQGGAFLAEAQSQEPQTLFATVVNFLDDLISVSSAYAADVSKPYTTDSQGCFWVRLDSSAPASVSVTVQAGENSETFILAGGGVSGYTYNLSALTVDGSGNLSGTIKVTTGGTNASGVAVTLAYATSGGHSTAIPVSLSLGTTGANGEVTVTGNVTALARNIRFTANSDSASAVTRQVGTVPSGFLTGPSVGTHSIDNTTSPNAAAYCASHGGRLPRIDNDTSWNGSGTPSIDGFGTVSGSWPSGLPSDVYWTGTEYSVIPGNSWIVYGNFGNVLVVRRDQGLGGRVVCVP